MIPALLPNYEIFRELGKSFLSPEKFTAVLNIDNKTLASTLGVHRNTIREHPDGRKTQDRLIALNRVFLALLEQTQDVKAAAFHMKHTPIRVLGDRTLLEAVKSRQEEKAIRYLQTISTGQNG